VASQGPLYCGTGADNAGVGSVVWSNPTNIQGSSLAAKATCALAASTVSHYLEATNFGFSLPATATLLGIYVEWNEQSGQSGSVGDDSLKLVKAGSVAGTEHSAGAVWSTTEGWVGYGGSSDLWGLALGPSDVNSSSFGTVLACAWLANTHDHNPAVYGCRITVYYAYRLAGAAGSFALTGGSAGSRAHAPSAAGSFALTGGSAGSRAHAPSAAGSFALTGGSAGWELGGTVHLVGGPGSVSVVGGSAGWAFPGVGLAGGPGSYDLAEGQLGAQVLAAGGAGAYGLSGRPAYGSMSVIACVGARGRFVVAGGVAGWSARGYGLAGGPGRYRLRPGRSILLACVQLPHWPRVPYVIESGPGDEGPWVWRCECYSLDQSIRIGWNLTRAGVTARVRGNGVRLTYP
jgi:hypothetical protein